MFSVVCREVCRGQTRRSGRSLILFRGIMLKIAGMRRLNWVDMKPPYNDNLLLPSLYVVNVFDIVSPTHHPFWSFAYMTTRHIHKSQKGFCAGETMSNTTSTAQFSSRDAKHIPLYLPILLLLLFPIGGHVLHRFHLICQCDSSHRSSSADRGRDSGSARIRVART